MLWLQFSAVHWIELNCFMLKNFLKQNLPLQPSGLTVTTRCEHPRRRIWELTPSLIFNSYFTPLFSETKEKLYPFWKIKEIKSSLSGHCLTNKFVESGHEAMGWHGRQYPPAQRSCPPLPTHNFESWSEGILPLSCLCQCCKDTPSFCCGKIPPCFRSHVN